MNVRLLVFLFILGSSSIAISQPALQCGPMLGYVEMREVCIWLQSTQPMDGFVRYNAEGSDVSVDVPFSTRDNEAHTAHIVVSNLEPGTKYDYVILSGGLRMVDDVFHFTTQSLWQYRTEPPEFTAAVGSCAFINETKYDRPGAPYGGEEQIFNSIATREPDLMIWLGDNTYLREVDYNSLQGMIYRYTHTRSIPELKELLSTAANYAIWDDHDFGPNDSNGSFIHKDLSKECFQLFWANNSSGLPGNGGITTQFTWGDIDFFLLDDRYFRTPPDMVGVEPTILGETQVQWLIQALVTSRSPFKMVCLGGQFLNPVANFENYAIYPKERDRIIELIDKNKINGVVFLTGDRHCTELSQLTLPSGRMIYDLTVSPFTSTAYDNTKEANTLRVEGTLVPRRNFATITFTGKRNERILKISDFDSDGNNMWNYEIKQPVKK